MIGGLLTMTGQVLRDSVMEALRHSLVDWPEPDLKLVSEGRVKRREVEGAIALALRQSSVSYDAQQPARRESPDGPRPWYAHDEAALPVAETVPAHA